MKKLNIFFVLFLLVVSTAFAQEKVVTLSDTLYGEYNESFSGKSLDGWIFKKGNDSAWSAEELDTKTWKSLKPDALTLEYADTNGRLECWFRIKIKFDSDFEPIPTMINSGTYGASTVYINGKKLHSFGKTGTDASNFQENTAYNSDDVPVEFSKDSTYTIAIHYVDYVTYFPVKKLKSDGEGSNDIIIFLNNSYYYNFRMNVSSSYESFLRNGIFTAIPISFALLFWIIFLVNPFEKNIRIFAIILTLFSVTQICAPLGDFPEKSFNQLTAYRIIIAVFVPIFICYIPYLLASVFKRNMHKIVKTILILYCAITIFLIFTMPQTVGMSLFILPALLSLYYFISSIRKINGAQWVIAIGYLSVLFFIFTGQIAAKISTSLNTVWYIMFNISAPFSFIIYTAMRFKEMMTEVRLNAEKVTTLSEEKRIQAENQKEILEVEVQKQTENLRTTIANLKSTQSQLIQSEKMASLGELTAGIAHEIQNPLNFVNNFSEVSNELVDEMNEELDKGDIEEAKAISVDIKQNLEKINHHGKRADGIVKGMLQHSRKSTGKKEPTDLNKLADEYLRLAYHGLRAKDKSFNADMHTDFDDSIKTITIIPQDIGRVVLNLVTNAFYAVNEKSKAAEASGDIAYKPLVSIATKKKNNTVEITVNDNGLGIPEQVRDKIFQPFFTTKPTGQGTGLGLSMSYDIVTKGHGGELQVETKEDEGTTFTITLPI